MTTFVIGPDVALRLARDAARVPARHQLLAPTLIRSQLLSHQYRLVREGELTRGDAQRQLDHIRSLRLRLLGDRVLQGAAWRIAEELGWADTFDAEYVALAQLHADSFVTLDADLARSAGTVVATASIDALEAAAPTS